MHRTYVVTQAECCEGLPNTYLLTLVNEDPALVDVLTLQVPASDPVGQYPLGQRVDVYLEAINPPAGKPKYVDFQPTTPAPLTHLWRTDLKQ